MVIVVVAAGALVVVVALYLTLIIFPALIIAVFVILNRLVRFIRKKRYFGSENFLSHKQKLEAIIAEHNELAEYLNDIRSTGMFTIGESHSGQYSNQATFNNTSKFGYKRDRYIADFSNNQLHRASLQVVRNASIEPIKYLIKYFNIGYSEESLLRVESLGESISRLENAIKNIELRREGISESFAPPSFILEYYLKEFRDQVGLSIPTLQIPYPKYYFQYISAGGIAINLLK